MTYQNFIEIFLKYWDKVPPDSKPMLVILLVMLAVSPFIYFTYVYLVSVLEKKRKPVFVKISFENLPYHILQNTLDFQGFFDRLHHLSYNRIFTFELHHSSQFRGFIFSCFNLETANSIRSFLNDIEGVDTEIVEANIDPLLKLQRLKDLSVKSAKLSQRYELIRTDEYNLLSNLVSILKRSSEDSINSILFTFRPVNKFYAIKSKIAKLQYRMSKNNFTDHNALAEIKQLENKNRHNIFSGQIFVVSNQPQISNDLISCFNVLNGENRFLYKDLNMKNKLNLLRYTPMENVFTSLFPSFFGSYFNSSEMSVMVHSIHS